MDRKRHSTELIINEFRKMEVHLRQGMIAPEVARKFGIAEQIYYHWWNEYCGLKADQARKLNDLDKVNARLKNLVMDISLEKTMLQEAVSENI